jgi:hypothetical protein
MEVAILWDRAPCSWYVNRRFGRTHHLHLQGGESVEQETSVQQVAEAVIFEPEDGGDAPLRKFGAISQKMSWFRNYRWKNLRSCGIPVTFSGSLWLQCVFSYGRRTHAVWRPRNSSVYFTVLYAFLPVFCYTIRVMAEGDAAGTLQNWESVATNETIQTNQSTLSTLSPDRR